MITSSKHFQTGPQTEIFLHAPPSVTPILITWIKKPMLSTIASLMEIRGDYVNAVWARSWDK